MPATEPIIHPMMTDLRDRIQRVEDAQRQSSNDRHEQSQAIALIQQDVSSIKDDVKGIFSSFKWFLGLILSSLVTALIGAGVSYFLT